MFSRKHKLNKNTILKRKRQKETTRKQRRKPSRKYKKNNRRRGGGVPDIAIHIHDNPPTTIPPPYGDMIPWQWGPYMYNGEIGEGWYIPPLNRDQGGIPLEDTEQLLEWLDNLPDDELDGLL